MSDDTDPNETPNEPKSEPPAAPTPADDAIRLLTEKLRQATEAQAAAEARAVAAEERAESVAGTTANQSQASSKERWAIVIDEGHSETENHDVFVQVNGRAYLIQRGLVVNVPPEVVSVLKDAVVGVSRQEYDEFGRPKGISVRNAPRHPYRVIGMVIDKDGKPVA